MKEQRGLFGDDEPAAPPVAPPPKPPSKVAQVCEEIKQHAASKPAVEIVVLNPPLPAVPPLTDRTPVPPGDQVRILASAIGRALDQIEKEQPETARAILSIALVDAQVETGDTS